MKRRNVWESLRLEASLEGPSVTITLPRDVAQELLGALMGSLEMEDSEDDLGMDEPDEDDFGGPPDGDADDLEGEFELADDDDSDDEDDEDDKKESLSGRGPRPGTALGESRRRSGRRW